MRNSRENNLIFKKARCRAVGQPLRSPLMSGGAQRSARPAFPLPAAIPAFLIFAAIFLAGAFTSVAGNLIDVTFTGSPDASKAGFAATGVAANDFWNVAPPPGSTNLNFFNGLPAGAVLTFSPSPDPDYPIALNGSLDPMYGQYVYSIGNPFTVMVSNLMAGEYDFYLYGHGNVDSQNSIFQLTVDSLSYGSEATTNGSGWLSPAWQEGVQYVEFTNVIVSPGQTVTLTVEPGAAGYAVLSGLQIAPSPSTPPPAFIITQPRSLAVIQGATAIFSVGAGGTAPLTYQWLFNDANIPAATNSSYIVTNAQPANIGSYSVIVTNAYGGVASTVVTLYTIGEPLIPIIDVAFTAASITPKVGLAAIGVTTNDFWNTCSATTFNGVFLGSGDVPNLKFMGGGASGARLTVSNVFGTYGDGASDPMYAAYLYSETRYFPGIIVTVTNLNAGLYDFYLYGHGNVDSQNSIFQLTVGSLSYGNEATTNGSGWLSPVWQEGVQFVEFDNVSVQASQTVTITAEGGTALYSVLSGLQMALIAPPTNEPPVIVTPPKDQALIPGSTAAFDVLAVGTTPFAYQWFYNNAIISLATNSSFIVTNTQPGNIGNYSVIVSNAYGDVTSLVAALNVIAPVATVIDVAFTSVPVTGKKGFAATGVTANDFWNTYEVNSGALPGLKYMDGTVSGAGLTAGNVEGAYGDDASDPMYSSYLFRQGGNITVTVTNLVAGVYDLYLYGHGDQNNESSIFQLTVDSQSYGSEATTNGSGWLSPVWEVGVQYAEFSNIVVSARQMIIITVTPGGGNFAVLSGLQIASVGPPLVVEVSDQFVNVNQEVLTTNFAYTVNDPVSFMLASNAPAGASISPNGIFTWTPACEQGTSTNLITIWATDSSSPPLSNSTTFTVTVGDCVEVSIGSSAAPAGQGACVPVSLVSSIGLTNLNFSLASPTGFLTNWNLSSTNSAIAFTTVTTTNPAQPQFSFGVQSGQTLLGSSVIGSICLDALPGRSAFVPLIVTGFGATTANNSPATLSGSQAGRVVVVGNQPLLEASLGSNSSRLLTLYGIPGANYQLLSATNLAGANAWAAATNLTLTQFIQTLNLGAGTNPAQFFQAVQH